jgi:hypothetical protein
LNEHVFVRAFEEVGLLEEYSTGNFIIEDMAREATLEKRPYLKQGFGYCFELRAVSPGLL